MLLLTTIVRGGASLGKTATPPPKAFYAAGFIAAAPEKNLPPSLGREPFFAPGAMKAMELNPPTLVHWVDFDLLSRLGVAAVLGLLLGLDREIRGHAAGLRTHGLICFSAAMMTVSVLALYGQLGGGDRMDPLRIFEATGGFIGIIGAGLIVFSRGQVHNLTTAAHLWLAAVIGIACGAAQWPLVVIGCVISLVMLTLLRVAERRWQEGEDVSGRAPPQK